MRVEQLPVFAKFVFMIENSSHCWSTTDINVLRHIKHRDTGEMLDSLEVEFPIYFEGDDSNLTYEITSVGIRQIVEDLKFHEFGFDVDDCPTFLGVERKYLFKVLIKMKLISWPPA